MRAPKRLSNVATVLALTLASNCFAQEQEPEVTESKSTSLWDMIQQGGWAMIPLAICSLALIYLIIHCLRETRKSKFGSDTFAHRLDGLCRSSKHSEAISAARSDPSLLGRAMANGLPKFDATNSAESLKHVEEAVEETFELEDHAIGQWIHYINVVATVSPMIGLLGTVSGMIGAFQVMAGGGMGRPELLAGNIGEALITTATGLCIGIPAMIFYSIINNRLSNHLVETAQRANSVIESLGQAHGIAPRREEVAEQIS